jgi:hypothetical protein
MSEATAQVIQAIASLCTIGVSIVALVIATRTEHRAAARFESEQRSARDFAMANVRPLLDVTMGNYQNERTVTLRNCGLGPAAITDVEFTKDDHTTRNLARLFELPVAWDTFYGFRHRTYYLSAGDKITLLGISDTGLESRGVPGDEVLSLLSELREQMRGVTVRLAYTDVFGTVQPELVKVL